MKNGTKGSDGGRDALAAYDKKAEADPDAPDIQIGRMKCLHALGEWDQLAAASGRELVPRRIRRIV